MKIIKELYAIDDTDKIILYAPLKRMVLSVNRKVLSLIVDIKSGGRIPGDTETTGVIKLLKEFGIITTDEENTPLKNSYTEYKPSKVTFLPTTDCNMSCIYCYADSGTNIKYLSYDIAKAAIDFISNNAKEKNESEIHVGFLGGGEPFLAWDLLKKIINYSRKKAGDLGLTASFGGVTNGLLSKTKIQWIKENFHFLNISIDGMKFIQDSQRPIKNNKSSFEKVIRTLHRLNELGFVYSVRSTISSLSLDYMEEIVGFFANELKVKRIHFEPLFACGRCKTNNELVPDRDKFIENYKKCITLAYSLNTELLCSAVRLDAITSTFCGAAGENFYITPEGYVTSCTEVSLKEEPLSDMFFIGEFDKSKNQFGFRKDRIDYLSSRTVLKMEGCQNCIAKWHCAGGCPAKAAQKGNMFNATQTADCQIARELTEYYIKSIASDNKFYYPQIKIENIHSH
jgi:uncharacterized protein